LLISSLSEYKKNFQIESYPENKEISSDIDHNNEIQYSQFNLSSSKNEYLSISNDIHSILCNCSELTNTQKLNFCNNQRYFMKLYLKELVIKVNKA
jgi:hypothetical protein